jgi:hypothetical protein
MKKGITLKLGVGVALAGAMALTFASRASADLASTITFTEPAETLVMPFDLSTGKSSFQIVSRIGGGDSVIATHWSYWSKDCRHLADVLICLTRDDTVVVDPSALQGEIQTATENTKTGPVINLTGELGMVTVTAFTASSDSLSRRECVIDDVTLRVPDQLVGSWTIANTATNAAFGHDAIGMSTQAFPDAATFFGDSSVRLPFFIQTFNPESLTDSEVIFITAEYDSSFSGNGRFQGEEIGPISFPGSPKVCCDATFIDNLEVAVSLPDVCFDCVGFAAISDRLAAEGTTALIPPTTAVNSSGLLQLTNCTVDDPQDGIVSISESNSEGLFLFAFHGQAVGPFGTISNGKYTGGLETNT